MTTIRETLRAPASEAPRWLRRLRRVLDYLNTAGLSEWWHPRPVEGSKEREG